MRKILNSHFFRILVCLVLICCFLVNSSPIKAEATSAEGIIGGVVSGGSVALTVPQIAILLLAAFGVYYTAKNADAIGYHLRNALDDAAERELAKLEADTAAFHQTSQAYLDWWESAKAGTIKLLSAPAWLLTAIKTWALGFIKGESSLSITSTLSVFDFPAYSYFYDIGEYSSSFAQSSVCFAFLTTSSTSGVSLLFAFTEPNVKPKFVYPNGALLDASGSASYTVNGNKYYYYVAVNVSSRYYGIAQEYPSGISNATLSYSLITGEFTGNSTVTDVFPDAIEGGISEKIEAGVDMDIIGLPDIKVPGADVLPVDPDETLTDAEAITQYLMEALMSGAITWEQYWQLIGVYNPDIGTSVPTVDIINPETGTSTKEEIGTGAIVLPSEIGDFTIDLSGFFPFCIPFDLYDLFTCLNAEPVAPVIEWVLPLPGGETYPLEIDLSAFDSVALLLRRLQLLLFCVGLAFKTRDLIKG